MKIRCCFASALFGRGTGEISRAVGKHVYVQRTEQKKENVCAKIGELLPPSFCPTS